MNRSFSPQLVRPNLPLRKPASSPAPAPATPPPSMAAASPARSSTVGHRRASMPGVAMTSPCRGDATTGLGSMPPALTAYFCNFCGHQANFQCQRCKKTNYCSEVCQKEDWKAHRHVCKSAEPDPTKDKQTTASPGRADNTGPLELKPGGEMSPQRVYLKDLPTPKIKDGSDIQVSLLEFYSPGRFFLCAQTPELLKALQSISTELQSTNTSASASTYAPCVGEVCAVQFSCDLNWYRGLVQTLEADKKSANILYIDFGNQENVPVNRIRPLTANVEPLCPCAMECCIAKVVPVGDNWSEECCATLKQLLAGKTLTARLVGTKESSHTHAVDILLSTGKQLSALLIEQGYAVKETGNSHLKPTEEEINAMVNASLENFKRRSEGKDDNTWAKPPEPLTQAVGDCFPIVVTHFKSPNEIIVQKVENAGLIQDLQLKLREHCSEIPAPKNFRPAPGTVCCAQFSEDKQWYRAKILAYSSEERVCVGYLDFGNSEEVDLTQLLPISASLLALPLQAIPCGIAGVQPVEESWSEECLLALQRRISNRILRMQIQGGSNGKVFVALTDEASDPQANIAELLISAAYAAPAPVNSGDNQQMPQTTAVDTEPCVSPPVSQPLVWTPAQLPHEGQTVALLASVVENPGEFFCHIDSPTDQQHLMRLRTELKMHCETNTSPFTPRVGEPCCAMFPGNTGWYRAAVKGLFEDKVEVNFVDYGYIVKTDKSHLRAITPQLLKLPIQVIRCWLTGVEPLGSEWSSEALLWFQTLVGGQQLSARVLSVTEQGCGVALESRGQDVAAALIAEQLAKAPGDISEEKLASASSAAKQPSIEEMEHSKMQLAAHQTAGSEETKELTVAANNSCRSSSAPTFPVDWKTVELPLNETFEPLIAAISSPSLFYVLHPGQADRQKLQEVMVELAAHCSNNQTCSSADAQSRLVPGAACCACFSADNNWYRAVVLEVGAGDMSVIYADFGNMEKVPVSRILPIPAHLLQLPFQITRCSLVGKEHFPAEWPEQVQELFRSLLSKGVLGTVQSFDGISNILSLAKDGEDVTAVIVTAVQSSGKDPGPSAAVTTEQSDSSVSASSAAGTADQPKPQSVPATPLGSVAAASEPEPQTTMQTHSRSTVNEDPVQRILEQLEPPCRIISKANDSQAPGCCCSSLKSQVDHLEQLMQTQLSLIKQLLGQAK